MDLCVYHYDPAFVLERFRTGECAYIDGVSEVEETQFFRYIGAHKILAQLAESYPSPRQKQEVPTWMYLASNLAMRLHGVHGFFGYPYVVRCGGMLNAFGPEVAHKAEHPESQDVTLRCAGFNHKNTYDRQTPCDQDFLRKLARDTRPERLQAWFNQEVLQVLQQHQAFDPDGIFLGDASYLFVPDNEHYEGSVRLLFDEHDHPVEPKALTAAQRARCRWQRCYKLVSLVHTNRRGEFFLYGAVAVVSGKAHECPVLYQLVEGFVAAVGRGVMKRLIADRGFLDGEQIGRCKREHGIDILIPARKGMDISEDALGLLRGGRVPFAPYEPPAPQPSLDRPPTHVPAELRQRERRRQRTLAKKKAVAPALVPSPDKTRVRSEVAAINDFRSWSSCPVPLAVILNKEIFADGHAELWMLLDTRKVRDAAAARNEYRLRSSIEERHRQLKCFLDLTEFTSRALSLIVNQVVFVLLAYTLLQLYLRRRGRTDLTRRTLPRVRSQLMPTRSVVILYHGERFALLSVLEYTRLLLTLAEAARKKLLAKTKRLQQVQAREFTLIRAP
jgi:hypothetical protein